MLSHAIFDPSFCLFENTEKGNYTLQINPNSGVNEGHLDYFQFIGRAVGLAVFHRRFLDAHFASSIYKLALAKPVTLEDMAMIDADLYQSLNWMLANDITDVIDREFTDEFETFGVVETVELKPGGAGIAVTEENKAEFIRLLCEHRLKGRVEKQLDAFKKGLYEIVPEELLRIFDERELELLIGGLSDIDVEDWERHTDYRGYEKDHQAVQWFWQAVKGWPMEKRSRLLQVGAPVECFDVHERERDADRVPSRTAVRHRHLAHAGQRVQGPAGLGRAAQVHDREGCRYGRPAEDAHVLQPDRLAERVPEL